MSFWFDTFFPELGERLSQLLRAPLTNPDMFWMVIPLIFILLVMTFYFGRYIREELGWNTAVANTVVLLFVAIDLLRHIFNMTAPGSILNYQWNPLSTIIAVVVAVEAITLMFASFFKALPKQITFFLCSSLPVNLQAYIAIAIVYTAVVLDWYTLLSAAIMFVGLYLIMKFLQWVTHKLFVKVRKEHLQEKAKLKKKK
ncbi:hypothetical protein GF358_02040 [Candidatus Woesearchaeota archaeon]|nr:hypothetical protein [Candidatus Woesearchaeota archaeon]